MAHTEKVAPVVKNEAAQDMQGQVGLGVDIVEIARMKAILARTPRFAERVFTAGEREYAQSKANPEIHFATRFAAKEAVLKALGTGFSQGIQPQDVEVKRSSKGRPYVSLHGKAAQIAHEQGIEELPISLSYSHTEAVACAMAITSETSGVVEQEDPMEALSRQFKELRTMLDDMDKPEEPQAAAAQDEAADEVDELEALLAGEDE